MEVNNQPTFDDLVTINNVHIRGLWNWNIHNTTCAICRNHIFESSINSNVNESYAVVGVCNHAFHQECISNWLKTRYVCPLCNEKWCFMKTNTNTNTN